MNQEKELKAPIYLRWYVIVLLAVIGFYGVLITFASLLLWLLDVVLIILRIRWGIQHRGQRHKAEPAPTAEPMDVETPAPVEPVAAPPVVEAPAPAETPTETEEPSDPVEAPVEAEEPPAPVEAPVKAEEPAPVVEASAPVEALTAEAEPPAPVEEPTKPEEPAPAEKPVIKKYMSDYHYDDVKLCIIKGQEPDFATLPIGTKLFFWLEPKNKSDKKAVKVCSEGDVKVGYLYAGKLRDMTADFVRRDDAVIGQVTYNDGQSIKFCMDFVRDDDDDDFDDDF